jgi:cytochrome P450
LFYLSVHRSLTSDEARKKTRKFVAPAFSLTNLKYTFDIVIHSLLKLNKLLLERADERRGNDLILDMNEINLKVTLDTIAESAFGVKFNSFDGEQSDGSVFAEAEEVRLKEQFQRTLNPFRKFMFWLPAYRQFNASLDLMKEMLGSILKSYRASHEQQQRSAVDNSIMGHLLRNDYASEQHRISDMSAFMTAGHETTSHSLTFLMICLSKYPACKLKLQAELDAAISSAGRTDRGAFPSASTLQALPYLTCCINEAMRLWPTAGAGSRRVTESELFFEGMRIPRGSIVTVCYFAIFREKWIDSPTEFIPERWLSSNPQLEELKRMFTPFALGSRNCIGQNLAKVELVMLAAYMLRFFDFELVSEPIYQCFLTIKAKNALMKVASRP